MAIALAFTSGSSTGADVSGSIGAAVAENTIANNVWAFIDSSDVDADGNVSITAKSEKSSSSTADYRISAIAFGVAATATADSSQGLTGALAGAGSSATNNVDNSILAYIANSTGALREAAEVVPTGQNPTDFDGVEAGGTLSLWASDDASIQADSGGYALSIAAGTGGSGGPTGTARSGRPCRTT